MPDINESVDTFSSMVDDVASHADAVKGSTETFVSEPTLDNADEVNGHLDQLIRVTSDAFNALQELMDEIDQKEQK